MARAKSRACMVRGVGGWVRVGLVETWLEEKRGFGGVEGGIEVGVMSRRTSSRG